MKNTPKKIQHLKRKTNNIWQYYKHLRQEGWGQKSLLLSLALWNTNWATFQHDWFIIRKISTKNVLNLIWIHKLTGIFAKQNLTLWKLQFCKTFRRNIDGRMSDWAWEFLLKLFCRCKDLANIKERYFFFLPSKKRV